MRFNQDQVTAMLALPQVYRDFAHAVAGFLYIPESISELRATLAEVSEAYDILMTALGELELCEEHLVALASVELSLDAGDVTVRDLLHAASNDQEIFIYSAELAATANLYMTRCNVKGA